MVSLRHCNRRIAILVIWWPSCGRAAHVNSDIEKQEFRMSGRVVAEFPCRSAYVTYERVFLRPIMGLILLVEPSSSLGGFFIVNSGITWALTEGGPQWNARTSDGCSLLN
jgi:hypothetical protein